MATTQLFAELLVIGAGAAVWLALVLAALSGHHAEGALLHRGTIFWISVGSAAYALGIAVDRAAYEIFWKIETRNKDAGKLRAELGVLERRILVSSTALGSQVHYNRSRLRVCRAWALNWLLIVLAFMAWNSRVSALAPMASLAVVLTGAVVCGLTGWAAWKLWQDHLTNLHESHEFLIRRSSEKESERNEL